MNQTSCVQSVVHLLAVGPIWMFNVSKEITITYQALPTMWGCCMYFSSTLIISIYNLIFCKTLITYIIPQLCVSYHVFFSVFLYFVYQRWSIVFTLFTRVSIGLLGWKKKLKAKQKVILKVAIGRHWCEGFLYLLYFCFDV